MRTAVDAPPISQHLDPVYLFSLSPSLSLSPPFFSLFFSLFTNSTTPAGLIFGGPQWKSMMGGSELMLITDIQPERSGGADPDYSQTNIGNAVLIKVQ